MAQEDPCNYINVIVVKNNVVEDITLVFDPDKAEQVFLEECRQNLSNFDEYTAGDIEAILEDGCERFGDGGIYLIWPNVLQPIKE